MGIDPSVFCILGKYSTIEVHYIPGPKLEFTVNIFCRLSFWVK